MINSLIKLATHLDRKGLHKEADYVDLLVKRADEITEDEKDAASQADRALGGGRDSTFYAMPPKKDGEKARLRAKCSFYRKQMGAAVTEHSYEQREVVKEIQKLLGFQQPPGVGSGNIADGCYGRRTMDAVKEYAAANSISLTKAELYGEDPHRLRVRLRGPKKLTSTYNEKI